MEIKWKYISFDGLTAEELYDILQLRSMVFVVEQDCVYQDIDGKDGKAGHLIGTYDGKIIAYSRIFRAGDYFSEPAIGRVVVHPEYRRYGIGGDMMRRALDIIKETMKDCNSVRISAQMYLMDFYSALGFVPEGDEYLEDGIPHRNMLYSIRR